MIAMSKSIKLIDFISAVNLLEYCGVKDIRIDESRFDLIVHDNDSILNCDETNYYENFNNHKVGRIGSVNVYNLGRSF